MASTKKFESIYAHIFLPETEESWDTIARSITNLTASCGDTEPAELLATMRSISRPLITAMNSERGRLSGVAIDLVAVVASCLGVAFEPLLPHFFPVLLTLSSRTSKVTAARARTCILTIIDVTHLPSILSYLLHDVTDKNEAIIRKTARDANADIRKVSRKVFEAYQQLLPSRIDSFTAPLTPTTRKYLDIPNKITVKSKPSHPHLPPASKAGLSSSTSVVRGPSSRRPPTHTRSASSPAVGPDANTPVEIDQPPIRSRSRAMVEIPLPKLPESTQPSREPVTIRPTSAIERKRVVSMSAAVRPVVAITKPGAVERARPVPASSSNFAPIRSRPVDDGTRSTKTTSVVARRVPIHEVPNAEKATRRIDISASTPAIRLAVPAPSVTEGLKPPVPKVSRSKDAAPAGKAAVKPKAREPAKSHWSKPTLSQIARAKTLERRVPVPTVSNLQRAKAVAREPVTNKRKLPARTTTVTPSQDDEVVPSGSTSSLIPDDEPPAIENITEEDLDEETKPVAAEDEPPAIKNIAEEDVDEETRPIAAEEELVTRAESSSPEPEDPEIPKDERDEARITVTVTETPPDLPNPLGLTTPPRAENSKIASSKTPISELLLSIERGFLFTPSAPLSPPDSYLTFAPPTNLAIPFPLQTLWPSSEESNEERAAESGEKGFEGAPRLESRRTLGDVAINK
ncbi:hypothetical protein K438DRAFT_1854153 [Mycena galopus ATCC 62051]|nr:hypothetical protein K438DRAFT_1854153 [Mycena galopus ATCC 62051]